MGAKSRFQLSKNNEHRVDVAAYHRCAAVPGVRNLRR
jgi:hypothetical protein